MFLSFVESCLLALNGCDDLARVAACAELQVPDTLPSSSCETAIGDGDGYRGTDKSGLDMSLQREMNKHILDEITELKH